MASINKRLNRQKSRLAHRPKDDRNCVIYLGLCVQDIERHIERCKEKERMNDPMRELQYNDEAQDWKVRDVLLLSEVQSESTSRDDQQGLG